MQLPTPVETGPLRRLASEWNELAEADALWAVLSDPAKKGGGWALDQFLASGEETVGGFLEQAAELGRPEAHGAALDFGCGAGRLVWGLSPHFDRVAGVDVSSEMVTAARSLLAARANVELHVNDRPDLSFLADGSFDFVLTLIVLQHVPSRELALGYVRELVRVTAPGGVAVIQAPARIPLAYRLQPLRRAYTLLRRLGVPARALILRT
ncbi:MAG: class I SAM-dependent methyltransferase, partial [Actinobacteria bacterium]|nr:class I SAM-dependent methyltransferase [Actinomycetota bacterium]